MSLANSQSFEFVCDELEARSELDRLAARGTVRIALKLAGLKASTVTAEQMRVVLERVIPKELTARGIENGDALSSALSSGLDQVETTIPTEDPEAVFKRLGGGT
jgi:hypothetical protein